MCDVINSNDYPTLVFVRVDSPKLLRGPWTTLEASSSFEEYDIFFVYTRAYFYNEDHASDLAMKCLDYFHSCRISTDFTEIVGRRFLHVVEVVSQIKVMDKAHETANALKLEGSEAYIQHQTFSKFFKSYQPPIPVNREVYVIS